MAAGEWNVKTGYRSDRANSSCFQYCSSDWIRVLNLLCSLCLIRKMLYCSFKQVHQQCVFILHTDVTLLSFRSSFPQATNQTLLDKFKRQHEGNSYIEFPAVMEPAFIIRHYAGKVKYGVKVGVIFTFAPSHWLDRKGRESAQLM